VKDLFLLDPSVVFLNHGSFGACPRPVFERYQQWQLELEREPVEFLDRERGLGTRFEHARLRLAEYLRAEPANICFMPNASTGLNAAVRSLDLRPGDVGCRSAKRKIAMPSLRRCRGRRQRASARLRLEALESPTPVGDLDGRDAASRSLSSAGNR